MKEKSKTQEKIRPLLSFFILLVLLFSNAFFALRYAEKDNLLGFNGDHLESGESLNAAVNASHYHIHSEDIMESTKVYDIHFLNSSQLSNHDGFSASWLQRLDTFLMMDLSNVHICEDAAFSTYSHNRLHMLRMTQDWLDFSLEHLSKWWKLLDVHVSGVTYHQLTTKLEAYLDRGRDYEVSSEFRDTLAVIAYRPYTYSKKNQSDILTSLSLAATIESLRRVGTGRVLVVGSEESEQALVESTFTLMRRKQRDGQSIRKNVVGDTEVTFVIAPTSTLKTKFLEKNMPRGALEGLRRAFLRASKVSDRKSREWLGSDPYRWKYIYLTEPDSLLQVRPESLPQIFDEVDRGNVLVPHRLQPIPHEYDVPQYDGAPWKYLHASRGFNTVLDMDPTVDACCDEMKGPDFKPGTVENCGNFWYTCGFTRAAATDPGAHFRLKPYDLVTFRHGSRIISLAGSEHGRRCFPRPVGTCQSQGINKEQTLTDGSES